MHFKPPTLQISFLFTYRHTEQMPSARPRMTHQNLIYCAYHLRFSPQSLTPEQANWLDKRRFICIPSGLFEHLKWLA
jgi:hypothetical protein